MCGIVGYLGKKNAIPILIDSLKRLEYRGYDSAGIAIIHEDKLHICKKQGKIKELEQSLSEYGFNPFTSSSTRKSLIGLGHTRWATHGKPSERNAHPHTDCSGTIAVVHNGIIENHSQLKQQLMAEGHKFKSDTDTEVIAHLVEKHLQDDLPQAVSCALNLVKGSYSVGIMSMKHPGILVGARNGSPLVIGLADDEYFIASDVNALLKHTKKVIFLDDYDFVALNGRGVTISNLKNNRQIIKQAHQITWSDDMAEKCGHSHFMHKEIMEQPQSIINTLQGHIPDEGDEVILPELNLNREKVMNIERIYIVACGTSYHAGLVGKFLIENLAKTPVEVDIGSEFRYREPKISANGLTIAITQSGETADTLAAMREAKNRGSKVISICNVVGSSVARESDGVLYTHAGPEIGVASTKAFTCQIVALYLIAVYFGLAKKHLDKDKVNHLLNELQEIPNYIQHILDREHQIIKLAKRFYKKPNFLFLGRGINYPIAMEGSLKLKEISYIHAEGYPAGEMKHGPIALIDRKMPVVLLIGNDHTNDKIISNMEEVKARNGKLIIIAVEGEEKVKNHTDCVFYVPSTTHTLIPILFTIPLQLLSYHISVLRGCDVDQPRNLAKSVTVE